MQAQRKYNDVKFFLIAIIFINAINYYLTYHNISFNWFFVLTFINDTVQGWLAWWAVRSIVIYLDKRMPYTDRPFKRIAIQFLLTTAAGLLIIIILTELSSWIVKGEPALLNFYTTDIFIIFIWFVVFNGVYVGMHYYAEWKESEKTRLEEKKIRAGGFTVKHGKQNLQISFEDMLGFYVDDGYTVLLTRQHKKYFPDKSLDKIEEALPAEWFFRLNRQYIVHRSAVTGFKRTGDGKIDVLINAAENFPGTIPVSRIKAAAFKNWFQPEAS